MADDPVGGTVGFKGIGKAALEFPPGSGAPQPTNPGRAQLRYNEVTNTFQASLGAGGWTNITEPGPSSDIVFVYSKGDLPTPVGGVITLDASKLYSFQAIVDLGTDRIDVNGSVLRGVQARSTGVTTDNAGAAVFTTAGANILDFYIENPSGPGFDLEGQIVVVANCRIQGCASVGRIGDCALGFQVFRVVTVGCQDGIDVDGTIGTGDIDTVSFISAAGAASYIGIDFTANANLDYLRVNNNNFLLNNAADQAFELDAAATLGNGLPGFFVENSLQGAGSAFGGTDQTDVRWRFTANGGIPDSDVVGNLLFFDNPTPTVISVSGTYVNIGTGATSPPHEAYTLDTLSERFSLQGTFPNQVLQYDGLRTETFNLTYNIVLEKVGGGTPNLSARIVKNGAPIAKTARSVGVAGAESSLSLSTLVLLSTGDTVTFEVANLSSTTNIIVRAANLLLTKSN